MVDELNKLTLDLRDELYTTDLTCTGQQVQFFNRFDPDVSDDFIEQLIPNLSQFMGVVDVVLSHGDCPYDEVLADFATAAYVGISTFNLSTKRDRMDLMDALNKVQSGTSVEIISNIPQTYDRYYTEAARQAGQQKIVGFEKLNWVQLR